MVDLRGHEIHTSNLNNISTTVTSTVNGGLVTNSFTLGNSNMSTYRSSNNDKEDDAEEEEEDDEEETKLKVKKEDKVRKTHTDRKILTKEKRDHEDNAHLKDEFIPQNYDEYNFKSGIDYQKLNSLKKFQSSNNPINSTKKLIMYKTENENDLDISKDASMRSLAKRTLTIGVPGLRPSSHKTLFIFSEENAIRKYSKIIIEWGYPF
ncbi:unnamed protein product [Heterobilharzia americana]|nr:unnamed protein product [Heterobilharzia americana]CAH8502642.1 unnamed protein product [Heterobilharzia americana]